VGGSSLPSRLSYRLLPLPPSIGMNIGKRKDNRPTQLYN
jgi:hypothetical protein